MIRTTVLTAILLLGATPAFGQEARFCEWTDEGTSAYRVEAALTQTARNSKAYVENERMVENRLVRFASDGVYVASVFWRELGLLGVHEGFTRMMGIYRNCVWLPKQSHRNGANRDSDMVDIKDMATSRKIASIGMFGFRIH